ncbi:uncharacterized protein LOC141708728 [Apium graveolens]|uniref:uncharacterized protein LOC141708728 n=1 Tax=Apium graveolens TaxID=4045 RepID=UPI003D7AF6B0
MVYYASKTLNGAQLNYTTTEKELLAYENNKLYREKVKRWHDRRLVHKLFVPGQQVLLFNSRLRLFPEKLKSRWSGPFIVKTMFPHGAVEIFDKHLDQAFKVNGQRLKHYYGDTANHEVALGTAFRATGVEVDWPIFGVDSVYPPHDTPPEEGDTADD